MFKVIIGGDFQENVKALENSRSLSHALRLLSHQPLAIRPLFISELGDEPSYAVAEDVTDLRWSAVYRTDPETGTIVIRVNELFMTHDLIEQCRKVYKKNEERFLELSYVDFGSVESYCYYINTWLAIVNHFGFDADYIPEFISKVDEVQRAIIFDAYVDMGASIGRHGRRRFHGEYYDRADFVEKFKAFFARFK